MINLFQSFGEDVLAIFLLSDERSCLWQLHSRHAFPALCQILAVTPCAHAQAHGFLFLGWLGFEFQRQVKCVCQVVHVTNIYFNRHHTFLQACFSVIFVKCRVY